MEQRHRFLKANNEEAAKELERTFRLPPRDAYTPANGRPNINGDTSSEKITIATEDLNNSLAAHLPEDVPTNGGVGRVPSLEDIAGMSDDDLRRYVNEQMAREPGQLDENAAAAFPRYRNYLVRTEEPSLKIEAYDQALRNRYPEVFSSHSEGTPTPIARPAPPNDTAPVPQPSTTARPGAVHPAGQRWRVHTFSEEFANKCNLNECIASHVKFIVSDK
ncbi:MAG: hypothetical protein J6A23_14640 [Thermoguttaceae bacterium]|nr:hypothetical protein [Thermoguttaceae bacterium]